MKAVMVMFDTLSRRYLSTYGNTWVKTPNFERLKEKSVQFDNFYAGSLPCMPARRELHTGRYNFLHRAWGPIEPCDTSCFELLKQKGIYTHIVTDHSHYWEDGGSTYLPRYSSWEGFRGQEGDRWVGMVNAKDHLNIPKQVSSTKGGESFYVNHANRTRMMKDDDFSSIQTFQAGLDFIDMNHMEDDWFLQIEAFDPHEPFHVPQTYLDLYQVLPEDVVFEWPSYAPVVEKEDEKRQIMLRYAALISMCDAQLGRVLDAFDTYNLWEDTMLLVNTDHGFLMGEHEWWGKNVQPAYNEVVHLPFYYYDPRKKDANGSRNGLCQTIDIPATLLSYFQVELPSTMLGKDLYPMLFDDKNAHDMALFGSHGGHVNGCDGRYVYMRASHSRENTPLYEYTLMPTRMRNFIGEKDLKKATLDDSFACFHHTPMLKIPTKSMMSSYRFGHKLFDLHVDPMQLHPLADLTIEATMIESMRQAMLEHEAPIEQYERLGLKKDCAMSIEDIQAQRLQKQKQDAIPMKRTLPANLCAKIRYVCDFVNPSKQATLFQELEQMEENEMDNYLCDYLIRTLQPQVPKGYIGMILTQLQFADKCD